MQKQAGHKKTWGMEWREKAAAYVDYLAAFLAPWQKLFLEKHWINSALAIHATGMQFNETSWKK